MWDQLVVGRGDAPATRRVGLVLVDDATARALGMPFSRDALVDLIDGLDEAGVAALALDLLIADRGPGTGDANLAAATADAPRVVHAINLRRGSGGPPAEAPAGLARFALDIAPRESLLATHDAVTPLPAILRGATHLGNVGLLVDDDGVIRSVPLLVRHGGRVYPALSLVTACLALGADPDQVRWSPGGDVVIPAGGGRDAVRIPVDRRAAMRISVRGGMEQRRPASLLRLLGLVRDGGESARRELERLARARALLLGVAVSGQQDMQPIPGNAAPPLVLAHAMATETIIGRDFLRGAGPLELALCVTVLVVVALLLGARLPWYVGLGGVPATAVAYWLVARWAASGGLLLPMVGPLLALGLTAVAASAYRHHVERRQRAVLSSALGRYLPRAVFERIVCDPAALRLGGRRRELTLVCLRLQGFNALSERLEPEEVGELLEPLFTAVSTVVARHDGTLDRYEGDGVRAFFGDPIPHQDHAERGVCCALELRAEARRVLARWSRGGRPRPEVGVGVHTGYATVGNIGAPQRMEYTVLGRNVEAVGELARLAGDNVVASGRTRSRTEGVYAYDSWHGESAGMEVHVVHGPRVQSAKETTG